MTEKKIYLALDFCIIIGQIQLIRFLGNSYKTKLI